MQPSPQQHDDTLEHFAAHGAAPLPPADASGHLDHDGARIWYATYRAQSGEGPDQDTNAGTGTGTPVILLHGGLGHSGNWGYQVPALVAAGHRVIVIDSRGHGRSTRDARPYSYELMASDVLAVMDTLRIDKAALVGWSDGACVSLVLASRQPERVAGVFFFGCNMDPGGTKPFVMTDVIERCFSRHSKDYASLSATPHDFDNFVAAVSEMMRTQPNYTADDLARIAVPVAIVQSEHDEFIKPEHADYLARSIPGAQLIGLPGVSHFAPLQRPAQFNRAVLDFLRRIGG
ncbi:alpha/beta hydrolase [Paraburkholderia sp. MMS20-SJTR3]|uniref:Alpha/beta hydrolase n=1 Tax=Paraburkholderia sejongensis TaxID=2886946 RepID=A0ABS8JSH3_9BURK|nr:alpha/beta hydrolase [Paraburkholderia sp. MMS20-SJTR3]MCC8392787.1 alpha/beta hydrolase [Paraburkholderia sp. MMS20-SJTR3]